METHLNLVPDARGKFPDDGIGGACLHEGEKYGFIAELCQFYCRRMMTVAPSCAVAYVNTGDRQYAHKALVALCRLAGRDVPYGDPEGSKITLAAPTDPSGSVKSERSQGSRYARRLDHHPTRRAASIGVRRRRACWRGPVGP